MYFVFLWKILIYVVLMVYLHDYLFNVLQLYTKIKTMIF
jgi:hypothetical protein